MPTRSTLGLQRAGMTATSHSSSPSGLSSVRLWPAFAALAALWLVSLPLACLPGPVPLAAGQVFHALAAQLGLAQPPQDASLMLVVGQIRLARVCLATLCGGALAVAGVALQGVLRNPLADPFTLGISAGAACGASIAIALGGVAGRALSGPLAAMHISLPGPAALVAPAALAGALLALAGALWLGRGDGGFRRESVILAGIAVAAFLGALVVHWSCCFNFNRIALSSLPNKNSGNSQKKRHDE